MALLYPMSNCVCWSLILTTQCRLGVADCPSLSSLGVVSFSLVMKLTLHLVSIVNGFNANIGCIG